jgi:hypothetical protein
MASAAAGNVLALVAQKVAKNGQNSRISRRNPRYCVVETLQPSAAQGLAAAFRGVLKVRDLDLVGSGQGDTTNGQLRNLG